MTNLFVETDSKIQDNLSKTWDDVEWVGTTNDTDMWDDASESYYTVPACEFDVDEFKAVAATITYDAGYGIQEINKELVIVFKDGSWLERAEYDGSEWWEYKTTPQRPKKHHGDASIKGMIYQP